MKYAIYTLATGAIVRAGAGPAGSAVIYDAQTEGVLVDTSAEIGKHWVDDGEPVAFTPEQMAARAARPAHPAHWSNASMAWVDDRTLEQKRTGKWEEIKAARYAAEFGVFTWDGKTFDCDPDSTTRITGAMQMAQFAISAGQAFSRDWILSDNTVATLDGSQMIAVGVALVNHVGAQYGKSTLLRTALEAATTAQEIDAVEWLP